MSSKSVVRNVEYKCGVGTFKTFVAFTPRHAPDVTNPKPHTSITLEPNAHLPRCTPFHTSRALTVLETR